MIQFRFLSIVLLLVLFSCRSPEPDVLYKIPRADIISLVKTNRLNYTYAKFVNQDGTALSPEMKNKLDRGELGMDYYIDKTGVIKEVRIRRIELADKMVEIQKRELASKPLSQITQIDIDCEKLDSIYADVEHSTTESIEFIQSRVRSRDRNNFYYFTNLTGKSDSINQQIVVSAITECGFTDEHLSIIWAVLELSPIPLVAYYYDDFKAFSNKEKLDKSRIAIMEDRLLMRHRYPQIYGTIVRGNKLYDLEDPKYVNERRARMNLEPIEDYLANWDLDIKEEVERMEKDKQSN